MKSLLLLPVILAISTVVLAEEPTCHAPKDKWMKQADFQKSVEAQGYKVKKIKVTNGCYELYGHDKDGKRVELSFDPATGDIAK